MIPKPLSFCSLKSLPQRSRLLLSKPQTDLFLTTACSFCSTEACCLLGKFHSQASAVLCQCHPKPPSLLALPASSLRLSTDGQTLSASMLSWGPGNSYRQKQRLLWHCQLPVSGDKKTGLRAVWANKRESNSSPLGAEDTRRLLPRQTEKPIA